MNSLLAWLDNRTGYKNLLHEALYENIPSGARFRYVTGSMLVFAFFMQAITGIFLWMGYSPSSQTAWESVYFIQHQMTLGWLLRGIHHFMAQAMVVVMAIHLLQVVIDGAYRAPREVNHWLGLVLMKLVLGLGLTGYLLPWDQKGYWATNVATNLMTLVPFVGPQLQQVVIGGNEYGHYTLTRFFAMHAGVLPALLIVFLVLHIMAFRRHGITAKLSPKRPDQYFWPRQIFYDCIACFVMLALVVGCVIKFGAELGAPADPSEAYDAARPEWYYLFLFQLLKYFHGESEVIGAIIIPGAVVGVLFLMPFIGRSKIGHRFNVVFTCSLLAGAGLLTALALIDDNYQWYAEKTGLMAKLDQLPEPTKNEYIKKINSSKQFARAQEHAEHNAVRMEQLVHRREWVDGKLSEERLIPKQGAVYLLRNDPKTQGPKLFEKHCASCHDYAGPPESSEIVFTKVMQAAIPQMGTEKAPKVRRDEQGNVAYDSLANGASNLYDFASREWINGLLDKDKISAVSYSEPIPSDRKDIRAQAEHPVNFNRRVSSPYFGNTRHRNGRMATWVVEHGVEIEPQDRQAIVAALSAQAQLRSQADQDANDQELIQKGVGLIQRNCANGCHRFGDYGPLGLAPDLTGYGSYEWTMAFLSDPTSERFYRQENDRMPSFAQDLHHPLTHAVSIRELSLIVDWLRGQYYEPADPLHPKPVLPHAPEWAPEAVAMGRLTSEPRPAIIGAMEPAPETDAEHAERLFRGNCAACHSHINEHGVGIVAGRVSAPNLFGIASREWLSGLLDPQKIGGTRYFGATAHFQGEMVGFVNDNLKDLDEEKRAALSDLIATLSAEAKLPSQTAADEAANKDEISEKGRKAIIETFACTDCHKFHEVGESSAPILTGYGSTEWLLRMISNPAHPEFYGKHNDRMPAFIANANLPKSNLLEEDELLLIVRWLRGELKEN